MILFLKKHFLITFILKTNILRNLFYSEKHNLLLKKQSKKKRLILVIPKLNAKLSIINYPTLLDRNESSFVLRGHFPSEATHQKAFYANKNLL